MKIELKNKNIPFLIKISPSKFVTFITETLLLSCINIMYFHARGRYICT